MKGETASAELEAARPDLETLGIRSATVVEFPVAPGPPVRVVRIESP
jgi:hypothetical protein